MKKYKKYISCGLLDENVTGKQAVNPLLPLDEYIPDVEARVFTNSKGEERVYLYGSHDEFGSKTWCSYKYHVYSSPVDDLVNWTDHGVSFASRKGQGYVWNGKDSAGQSWTNNRLYAPDVNKIGDMYCLVTCNCGGPCLGMAISKNPEGPFSPAKKILYSDGTETNCIDPTLYVEGAGENLRVYMLWGQTTAFGAPGLRGLLGAELIQDSEGLYTVVKKETERVLFTGENDEFGFYEGASLRKINNKYYVLYPSNHGKGVHMMSYAVADEPLGPYTFGGDILDNDGCDLRSGNDHGSFCKVNGNWYLFYHRGFGNSDFQRKVCVERIYIDDGKIGDKNGNLVAMTNHGFGGPLNPYKKIEAAYVTRVRLDGFKKGCYLTEKSKNLHPLINISNGNVIEYRDFDFGDVDSKLTFIAKILPRKGGSIDIILDEPNGKTVGTLYIKPGRIFGKYQELSSEVDPISGVHTIYFRFNSEKSGRICDFASFIFIKQANR